MRAWLHTVLSADLELRDLMNAVDELEMQARVIPRRSQNSVVSVTPPYIVYGLGTETAENIAEAQDHEAARQFFQIWVHDEGGDYGLIDQIVARVIKLLTNAQHPASKVTLVRYLETSQEFANETYNTLFRYVRFQAIRSKGAAA